VVRADAVDSGDGQDLTLSSGLEEKGPAQGVIGMKKGQHKADLE
jgi:hypothetical protein